MFKVLLLLLFARFFGIPIIPIIILIVLFYLLDRRFIGLLPNITKPIRRLSRIRKLRGMIASSPHDVSAKLELGRLLIERKKYRDALELLEPLERAFEDSAEYWDDMGNCYLHTGNRDRGEACIVRALDINPRVKYGAPYLRLAALHAKDDKDKALSYMRQFQEMQSSSCEAYNTLAIIYKGMGQTEEAKRTAEEGLRIYRMLPRYKKRQERKWALRLFFKK